MLISFQFLKSSRALLGFLFISTAATAAIVASNPSIPELQSALHTNAAHAVDAANAVARLGPSARAALPDLADALHFDEDSVTTPVGDAMVAIGPESVPPLLLCLKDPNLFVRQRAAVILGRFGVKAKSASQGLAALVLDPSYQVDTAARQALLKIGPDALPALIAVFNEQDEKGQLALIDVIGGLGTSATPFLIRTLAKSENIFVRVKATEWLGSIRPTSGDVVNGLIDTLNNLDERVRLSAVNGLNALGDQAKQAIGPLIVASQIDSDPLVRQKALDTIAGIGTATAVSLPGLSRAMHCADPNARLMAVSALAECREDPVHTLAVLQTAARDADTSVHAKAQAAIMSLQNSPTPATVKH